MSIGLDQKYSLGNPDIAKKIVSEADPKRPTQSFVYSSM